MKMGIDDLRYNMKDVFKALNRNEPVQLMYRGVLKGTIEPIMNETVINVEDHPFFGMSPEGSSMDEVMDKLIRNR